MAKIKEGDWVELDFIAQVKRTGQIFDLTKEKVAKDEGVYQENQEYEPRKIKIGSGQLIKGLDEFLVGKKTGEKYEVDIEPEKGFGKRNPDLIQLTSSAKLKKKGVNPVPGRPLNIDGKMATVRSVSGGRVILDFNHPLSGKELKYEVWPQRKIEKTEEKVKALSSLFLRLEEDKYKVKCKDNKVEIEIEEEIPEKIRNLFSEQLKSKVEEVEKVKFTGKGVSEEKKKSKKESKKSKKQKSSKKSEKKSSEKSKKNSQKSDKKDNE